MADKLPVNCQTLAITEYDGTTDPLEHLARFENAALLHSSPVPEGFEKQDSAFLLYDKKDNEPLKEYLQRFNTAALEVPSATQEVKASAFSQGLLDGDFFMSLAKKVVSKFDALLARAAKYINMEDAQAAKKESRGENRKEVKEETPSRKPRNGIQREESSLAKNKCGIHSVDGTYNSSPHGSRRKRAISSSQNGYLQEYVCWEKARGTDHYQKKETDRSKEAKVVNAEASPRGGPKMGTNEKTDPNNPPRKGVIWMIIGGPIGSDSHYARKAEIRRAHNETITEILDVETAEDAPIIQFGRTEHSRPKSAHNDALVITALLANY
ncbi:UNVERIFIED_CONTAM: hypothetical protein Slati_0465000 [Sesamum latifolium]|uniref:Uncharacterized protein n=1 Tax=Sesamum latifolium TaxID=2727402 RepID=A0AAW2XXU8_9LAMI